MKKNHIAIVGAIAAFIMMALIFLEPVKLQTTERKFSQSEQLYCTVAVSSTLTLAETKPRMDGFTAANFLSAAISPLLFQEKSVNSIVGQEKFISTEPRPLWLLYRSLLI